MKRSDLMDRMPCKIRRYLYSSPVISGAVGRNNRSAVNMKQCSKRGLNYPGEYGLVFVSMFVTLEKTVPAADAMSMQPK